MDTQRLPRTRLSLFHSDVWKIFAPAILLTVLGFFIAYQFVQPAPPRDITIATGGESGAYYLFGQRYREQLAERGITLTVRVTSGSVENLELLRQGEVDIAFVQGGIGASQTAAPALASLASLYYEPLWVFSRNPDPPDRLAGLRGKRIAIGNEGSGTRVFALRLLADNDMLTAPTVLLDIGGTEAETALREGRVDAALFVTGAQSPLVQRLLNTEDITLMNFRRAEAYTRRYRFLSRVGLAEGMIDLTANIPRQNTILLAPVANLVVREDFHPALIDLVLQTAKKVHGPGGLFEKTGEFPSAKYLTFSLHPEAERYFNYGPPFLQRYLPFWAATLVDRLKIMLLPLIALLLPLIKLLPALYTWRMRSKIYRWYDKLQAVSQAMGDGMPVHTIRSHLQELDSVEAEVSRIAVPLAYNDILYNLLLHVDLIRAKLLKRLAEQPEG